MARTARRTWSFIGRIAGIAGVSFFACLSYSWITLPDVRPLRTENPASTAFMQMRAHEARAGGKSPVVRQRWLPLGRIAPILQKAVLTAEDAGFYGHDGIDYDELQASIEINWQRGHLLRGASTITQQLAKNLYLTPQKNPYRKIVELMIARQLEANLRKARILELYLNVIEWGDGIWGADAAARAYFGRSASDVTMEQAALLAGAIPNPRVYNPSHPSAGLMRRKQIIAGRINRGVALPTDGGSVRVAPGPAELPLPPEDLPSADAPVPQEADTSAEPIP